MGMEVTVVPGGAVLSKSRTIFLEANLIDCDGRIICFFEARAGGWRFGAVCVICVLLFHGVVSRLGRNFIVREPIFCVAHGVFCVGAFGGD